MLLLKDTLKSTLKKSQFSDQQELLENRLAVLAKIRKNKVAKKLQPLSEIAEQLKNTTEPSFELPQIECRLTHEQINNFELMMVNNLHVIEIQRLADIGISNESKEPLFLRNFILAQLKYCNQTPAIDFPQPWVDFNGVNLPDTFSIDEQFRIKLQTIFARINQEGILDLSCCPLGDVGAKCLANMLETKSGFSEKITHLILSGCRMGHEGFKTLLSVPGIHRKRIILDGNIIGRGVGLLHCGDPIIDLQQDTILTEEDEGDDFVEAVTNSVHGIALRCDRDLSSRTYSGLKPLLRRNYLLAQLKHNFPENPKDFIGKILPDSIQLHQDYELTYLKYAQTIKEKLELTATLDLSGEALGDIGVEVLADILRDDKKLRRKVKHLILAKNEIGPQGLQALLSVPFNNLQTLDLNENDIGRRGAELLEKAASGSGNFSSLNKLIRLKLSSNNLGGDSANHLAEVVRINQQLQDLELSSNHLGTVQKPTRIGCAVIMAPKPNINTLQRLAAVVEAHPSLKILELSRNGLENGAEWFASVLRKNNTLEVLDLCSNGIEANSNEKLLLSLKHNTSLLFLNLTGNIFNNSFVKKIANFLDCKPKLTVKIHATHIYEHLDPSAKKIADVLLFHSHMEKISHRQEHCHQKINPVKERMALIVDYLNNRRSETRKYLSCIFGYSQSDYDARAASWRVLEAKITAADAEKINVLQDIQEAINQFDHGYRRHYATHLKELYTWLSKIDEKVFNHQVASLCRPL